VNIVETGLPLEHLVSFQEHISNKPVDISAIEAVVPAIVRERRGQYQGAWRNQQ
jgi:hypothetical protein